MNKKRLSNVSGRDLSTKYDMIRFLVDNFSYSIETWDRDKKRDYYFFKLVMIGIIT